MRANSSGAFIGGHGSGQACPWSTSRARLGACVVVALAIVSPSVACGKPSATEVAADASADPSAAPDAAGSSVGVDLGSRPPPRLAELRVADLTPPELRLPGIAARLDAILSEAVFASFVRAPADEPGACRAELAVGYALVQNRQPVLEADAGEARAVFEGEVFCPSPSDPKSVEAFRMKLDLERPFGGLAGGTGGSRLEEVLREVVRDGADSLFGQVRARHASDAEIASALARSEHPGVLAEAASEAGERHLVAAVPELVRLTAHANRRVATRAGAALGLLKVDSPEVLRALVRMTEGPDAEKHLVAIHALADLGSAEARRYLESIALGHPSPGMRQLARERLGRSVTPPEEPAPEPVPD